MGGDERGDLLAADDGSQQLHHGETGLGVELTGGLVGDQERGLVGEGPGDRDPLLLTAGQLAWPLRRMVGEPTRDSSSSTRSSRSRGPARRSRIGTPTFSAAVRIGMSPKDWKTNPMRSRRSASSPSSPSPASRARRR